MKRLRTIVDAPKVSILMGVYNCKSDTALKRSVQSIICQTFVRWEFLICNDGSSDRTIDILREIAAWDARIVILDGKENRGLAGALNLCLRHASGEYIARQDADGDTSSPNRLIKQLQFLETHTEYDFVGCCCKVFDPDNGFIGRLKLPERVVRDDFLWNSPFAHPTVMFRKRALEAVGGYRSGAETKRCEDYDLFMRMYAAGARGYNLQENLYAYKISLEASRAYRPLKDRIDEAMVRYRGFRALGILPKGIPYIIKPLLIGMIPRAIFHRIRKWRYGCLQRDEGV